jgi:predicted DNA-binding transcriptional regulator YafY
MHEEFIRQDRTARLVKVANLLFQNYPHGLTAQAIADCVGRSVRTVNRDLRALDRDVGIKFWQEGNRYVAEPTEFLPDLKLTLHEAVTLFLSARVMARYQDHRDPHITSLFTKLASIVPTPIARHLYASIAGQRELEQDDHRTRIFEILATAWADSRKVRVWYPSRRTAGQTSSQERVVSPYSLEPNASGHALYLIGYDGHTGQVRTFKVGRIEQVELTQELFDVPSDYDQAERLRHAWGVSDEDLIEVRLRFHDRQAAERARESHWHPSQREDLHADGTVDLTFDVGGLLEITPWVLSWGGAVEALAPRELRQRVAAAARLQAALYA